ncbi:hypothetical protein Murru_1259 [Allomuricauda ruestringensis DSM 13258]|uniref:Bacteriophage abortive infection AbiH n=1 Tax=Allomuricauda ruestringensis (strain DSM 13258 / CIP 107369 / LMG 19739 / B1) TaxID=886377 RepID=G2PNW7_ALLRU|nr:bacteriophage abortive infection AbiH family protein [Allomuricauda ruestringensis]AEM70302.1 hypothetical protein Murru_1259 [Allomuricauda ruestringensis DSM 13258]
MGSQVIFNRIILIGNGFDRSLGMPTSYSHFLDWSRLRAIKNALENKPSLRLEHQEFQFETNLFRITTNEATANWLNEAIKNVESFSSLEKKLSQRREFLFKLSISPKHPFITELLKFDSKYKWVDIEQMYFDRLLKTGKHEINGFHLYFGLVKQELLNYLSTLEINKDKGHVLMSKYRKHFFGKILQYDSSLKIYEETDQNPTHFYFVNFNYTNFLLQLMEYSPSHAMDENTINHIHGNLNEYPIVFGYGNETGENYSKLESLGNDYLENIKSTHYFNSTHYRDLEIQLNSPYEVYVYGLSCGLSDQILLNTIMQKENCKQIRIFYNKYDDVNDNYRETLMNISRVFDDKEVMRSKIISKQPDDFIRQIK